MSTSEAQSSASTPEASVAAGSAARAPMAPPKGKEQGLLDFLVTAAASGEVVCLQPGKLFLVSSPRGLQHVLQVNHANYLHPVPEKPLMGHRSLTMSRGEAWRQRRRLMQPAFNHQRLDFLGPEVEKSVGALLRRWQPMADAGESFDLSTEMVHLSLEALIGAIFGKDSDPGLVRSIHDAFRYFDARTRRGGRAPHRYAPTRENLRLQWSLFRMRRYVRRIISRRRRGGGGGQDLLGSLLAARDQKSGKTLSDLEMQDELMMLLVMGHMTTAVGLTWAWVLLARHPEIEAACLDEVRAALGDRPARVDDLERMPRLRQVVQESLRLYPPTWSFSRTAVERDVVCGFEIPAGATVMLSPYATHRLESLWPDPETFDPGRFSPEASRGRDRFAYLPFGGGVRSCIAAQWVMIEAPLVIAEILRSYHLRIGDEPIPLQPAITLGARGGVRATLERRGEA